MFLLVPAHPGFPGQIPQSRKTVVCVCVFCYLSNSVKVGSKKQLGRNWQLTQERCDQRISPETTFEVSDVAETDITCKIISVHIKIIIQHNDNEKH